jgi:hypothetical protein
MDSVLASVPLLGALVAVLLGAVGLLRPLVLAEATGLATSGLHGMSELRAVFGGNLGSIGLVCLITREPAAFLVGAAAFMGGGVAKLISLAIDRPEPGKVVPGLILDFVVGAALLAGHLG